MMLGNWSALKSSQPHGTGSTTILSYRGHGFTGVNELVQRHVAREGQASTQTHAI